MTLLKTNRCRWILLAALIPIALAVQSVFAQCHNFPPSMRDEPKDAVRAVVASSGVDGAGIHVGASTT